MSDVRDATGQHKPYVPDGVSPPEFTWPAVVVGALLGIVFGASSLYLTAHARPSIRVDDEILPLETEAPLGKAEVEALILEMAPGASRDAFAGGSSAEWVYELPDVGRVRCVTFRDQRGPGAVFRLIPTRLISADQLGLSPDIPCGR